MRKKVIIYLYIVLNVMSPVPIISGDVPRYWHSSESWMLFGRVDRLTCSMSALPRFVPGLDIVVLGTDD